MPPLFRYGCVSVGILVGVLLFGFETRMGFTESEFGFDVMRKTKHLSLFPASLGALAGGAIGYVMSIIFYGILSKYYSKLSAGEKNNQIQSRRLGYSFVGLALLIWVAAQLIIRRFLPSVTSFQAMYIIKYTVILSLVISWVLIGRKIVWKSRVLDWLSKNKDIFLLGPFNSIKLTLMNKKQLRVIWVSILLILLLCVFPPWKAYRYASGEGGLGSPDFIDFHSNLSGSQHVIVEAPYVLVEVDYELLRILIGLVVVACLFLVFLIRFRNRVRHSSTELTGT